MLSLTHSVAAMEKILAPTRLLSPLISSESQTSDSMEQARTRPLSHLTPPSVPREIAQEVPFLPHPIHTYLTTEPNDRLQVLWACSTHDDARSRTSECWSAILGSPSNAITRPAFRDPNHTFSAMAADGVTARPAGRLTSPREFVLS